MKRNMKKLISIVMLVLVFSCAFGTKSYASSDYPYAFDFEQQVLDISAGSTATIWVWSRWNYTYYISEHTSRGTYLECSFRSNTEQVKVHIGQDEQAKNITFYFYVDEDGNRSDDYYGTVLVHVKDIKQGFANPEAEALKAYAGNTAEFNAYYYYVNYADLQAAFGTNGDALLNHWKTFGIAEGRIANKVR